MDIRPGTRLATFAAEYERQSAMLPEADGEDSQPFPIWFRVFLRESLPQLPTSGAPQYPRQAEDVARWLLTHQDFRDEELQQRVEELRRAVPGVIEENQRRAQYPKNWEVDVPEGTKLDEVRKQLTREFHLLPAADLEDESPLPIWFRVYLRKTIPDLPTSGPYQYPRTSSRILQRLLDNPNTVELPK